MSATPSQPQQLHDDLEKVVTAMSDYFSCVWQMDCDGDETRMDELADKVFAEHVTLDTSEPPTEPTLRAVLLHERRGLMESATILRPRFAHNKQWCKRLDKAKNMAAVERIVIESGEARASAVGRLVWRMCQIVAQLRHAGKLLGVLDTGALSGSELVAELMRRTGALPHRCLGHMPNIERAGIIGMARAAATRIGHKLDPCPVCGVTVLADVDIAALVSEAQSVMFAGSQEEREHAELKIILAALAAVEKPLCDDGM